MNSAEREDSFLTVAEVAEMLKLNQQTVRNWIDQGSLPALRVGRRVRIKRSDFERVLERSYTGSAGGATREVGPSAEDFWGGEPGGVPDPGLSGDPGLSADPGLSGDPGLSADPGLSRDEDTVGAAERT
jgi:excisionase family DNA binding protein